MKAPAYRNPRIEGCKLIHDPTNLDPNRAGCVQDAITFDVAGLHEFQLWAGSCDEPAMACGLKAAQCARF